MEEIEKLDSNSFHVDNTLLVPFLRKLIIDLENNEIYPTTRKLLGEFYMDVSFIETFKIDKMTKFINSNLPELKDHNKCENEGDDQDKGHDNSEDKEEIHNEEKINQQPTENDMSKFLVLGWYIYTHIIKGNKTEEVD